MFKMVAMPTKDRPTPLSDQLRDAVLDCGETRYSISKTTGISEATLSKFVNGHQGLSLDKVDVLAEHLGLKLIVGTKRKGK